MNNFKDKPTEQKSIRKPWLFTVLFCAVLASVALYWNSRDEHRSADANNSPAESITDNPLSNMGSGSTSANESSTDSSDKTTAESPSNATRPTDTRASHRDTVTNSKGERKKVIDPIASWDNPPPWPEGGRLYAEVETSERKYVNLRPDEVGEMPRILAKAEEQIELKVNFPDATPGEKIYVEIPNGGTFPDSDMYGRLYELPENRTLSFPYVTDDANGYCTVMIRQGGHTRSLPIWVGEL